MTGFVDVAILLEGVECFLGAVVVIYQQNVWLTVVIHNAFKMR